MRKTRVNALRDLRIRRGLTQEEVAKALGISREQVSRFETGNRRPSWNALVPLSRLYRVSLEKAEAALRMESRSTSKAATA